MGTAPTEGNTNFSSLMDQTKRQSTALQAVETMIRDLAAATAGGGGWRQHKSNKDSKHPPAITSTKEASTVYL